MQDKKTILIVDDEKNTRRFYKELLLDQGYEVITAATPLEALQQSKDNIEGLDLILTDKNLKSPSGIDGLNLVRLMRDHFQLAPAILMSSINLEHPNDLTHYGIERFYLKGSDYTELLDMIKELI